MTPLQFAQKTLRCVAEDLRVRSLHPQVPRPPRSIFWHELSDRDLAALAERLTARTAAHSRRVAYLRVRRGALKTRSKEQQRAGALLDLFAAHSRDAQAELTRRALERGKA